jgi:putative hemolysin
VKREKLERKLRKKAKKLARFAGKHGIEYASVTAYMGFLPSASVYCVMDGGSKVQLNLQLGGEVDA